MVFIVFQKSILMSWNLSKWIAKYSYNSYPKINHFQRAQRKKIYDYGKKIKDLAANKFHDTHKWQHRARYLIKSLKEVQLELEKEKNEKQVFLKKNVKVENAQSKNKLRID